MRYYSSPSSFDTKIIHSCKMQTKQNNYTRYWICNTNPGFTTHNAICFALYVARIRGKLFNSVFVVIIPVCKIRLWVSRTRISDQNISCIQCSTETAGLAHVITSKSRIRARCAVHVRIKATLGEHWRQDDEGRETLVALWEFRRKPQERRWRCKSVGQNGSEQTEEAKKSRRWHAWYRGIIFASWISSFLGIPRDEDSFTDS